ncbi:MAG: glycerol-3-phosphate 1-O-acyltransferase PlsY [Verrucomicrobiota bacterium]|nr:glycerol-3-phosphate 1-O-acyltransferase PlsY [Verrucomicrobiota bacterium]
MKSVLTAATVPVGVVIMGYLLGSVPFGFIAGRINGIDIRLFGSHNIGATNVLRTLGKRWGAAVFVADALKGAMSVGITMFLVRNLGGTGSVRQVYSILAAAACVVGHSFPLWLKFKGGKGVATSAGAIVAIMPFAAFVVFCVWVVVFHATRYVSLASIVGACALPLTVAILIHTQPTYGHLLFYFSLAMATLVVWRHRSNISRLINGTEPRFERK